MTDTLLVLSVDTYWIDASVLLFYAVFAFVFTLSCSDCGLLPSWLCLTLSSAVPLPVLSGLDRRLLHRHTRVDSALQRCGLLQPTIATVVSVRLHCLTRGNLTFGVFKEMVSVTKQVPDTFRSPQNTDRWHKLEFCYQLHKFAFTESSQLYILS